MNIENLIDSVRDIHYSEDSMSKASREWCKSGPKSIVGAVERLRKSKVESET